MSQRLLSATNNFLALIEELAGLLPLPLETPHQWVKRTGSNRSTYYYTSLFRLKQKGYVKVYEKKGKKFIQLTKQGYLSLLFEKAKISRQAKWDGKWRLVIFDIPESARKYRSELRFLLKSNGFRLLQGSVYISPYPLNSMSIKFLKESELIKYIRIFRIDRFDSDKDLKKLFKK